MQLRHLVVIHHGGIRAVIQLVELGLRLVLYEERLALGMVRNVPDDSPDSLG